MKFVTILLLVLFPVFASSGDGVASGGDSSLIEKDHTNGETSSMRQLKNIPARKKVNRQGDDDDKKARKQTQKEKANQFKKAVNKTKQKLMKQKNKVRLYL